MSNIYSFKNSKSFILAEYNRRLLKNPKYSLRAFARDIHYSSARLSQFMNGSRGISLKSAHTIGQQLGLTEYDHAYFINLVISDFSKSIKTRHAAKKLIQKKKVESNFSKYENNQLNLVLSKWYYALLIDMLTLASMPTPSEIAKVLKITKDEVEAAIFVLAQHNLVRRSTDGRWHLNKKLYQIKSPLHAKSIHDLFKMMLNRAALALDLQSLENRKFLFSSVQLNKSDLMAARAELEKFNLKFIKKYNSDQADSVYCLGLQFFELK